MSDIDYAKLANSVRTTTGQTDSQPVDYNAIADDIRNKKTASLAPTQGSNYWKDAKSIVENAIGGAVELPMNLISGAIATPIAGLSGLSTMAANKLGLSNDNPADVVNSVQSRLTYDPASEGGKNATRVFQAPFQAYANKAEDIAGNAFPNSPASATAYDVAMQLAPALIGGKVVKPESMTTASLLKNEKLKATNALRDATLAEGRAAGFKISPASVDATSTKATKMLEKVAGKAQVAEAEVVNNAQATNAAARQYLGLPDDAGLSPALIKQELYNKSGPYREISALPKGVVGQTSVKSQGTGRVITKNIEKDGATLIEELKDARDKARAERKSWQGPNPTAKNKRMADAYDAKALELESQIDTLANLNGTPDLVTRLQESRKQLAKIHSVDEAMNEATGTIDPKSFSKQRERGVKLDAEAKLIADMNDAFPRAMGSIENLGSTGTGKGNFWASASGMGMGSGLGYWLGGPSGSAIGGGVGAIAPQVLPSLAENILLSKKLQKAPTYGPTKFTRNTAPYATAASGLSAQEADKQRMLELLRSNK